MTLQFIAAAGLGWPSSDWFVINTRFYLVLSAAVIIAEAVVRLAIVRPVSPFRYLSSPPVIQIAARRTSALLPIAAVGLFMPAFSAMKSSIGRINPFAWDETFIALDQAIHGTDPWRLLQPIMGHPIVSLIASNLYHLWFALIYLGPIVFAFYVRERRLRLTFFIGYFATWTVVGMVFATLLSSVGPCFVGPILGNQHFAEQMAYLHEADRIYPLAVLDVQQLLLDWHRSAEGGFGRGITAMPSMHVALCWLYVLATWRIDRRIGLAFFAFFVAIQLSSVHLAYHYAVDGYLSVLLVTAIWFACGKVAAAVGSPASNLGNPRR
ncbi:phosphatase PAP2 family protein [Pelagerythrobacter sp.]|uniref:phosphatase PAP2 family protein n=1 Tax=Pelagerythrobacter sp. TaxID=2800702 RepID=UPI0035B1710B